jgi:hypothetical protein
LLGAINWFGWKFVLTPVTASMISFNSIVVRQTNGADISGNLYFDDLQTELSTGVKLNDGVVHKSFTLYQNYPNPFNPATTIAFELERPEYTTLTVFNTLGQQVATLINNRLEAGSHRVQFTSRGSDGRQLPSGVYIYRLRTSAGVEVKRMLLLK